MDQAIDLFVIGAGVAGMTAAQAARQRGLSVALAEGNPLGFERAETLLVN